MARAETCLEFMQPVAFAVTRPKQSRALAAALATLALLLLVRESAAAQALVPASPKALDGFMGELAPRGHLPLARYYQPGSDDVIVAPQLLPARRHRGDWEPIDLLVLVHNPDWEEALRFMVERAATRVPVQVLMPATERDSSTQRFRAFAESRCVSLTDAQLNTPWIRDYGPLQVFDSGKITWLDFAYYPERQLDDTLTLDLGGQFRVPVEVEPPHVDGGAVVSNGRGLCAMTDASLADAGVHLRGASALEQFAGRLGCRGLAVLPALPREQTSHADVMVQFLAQDVAAVGVMDHEQAPEAAERLDLAVGALRRVAHALGEPLRVIRIPMHAEGDVFYSYLNITRVRDLLFVPDYRAVSPALQREAHAQLQAALPDVSLVKVPADGMVPLGGAIHCITLGLNIPAAPPALACAPKHAKVPTRTRRARQ